MLITKQRSTVLFLLTLLILFGTSNIGYAQAINPPLSERTPQIRNAIVAAVPGVNTADNVTAAHLAAITKLRISRKNITALKAGDFNGLTSLIELHLWENSISDISPLAGLTSLTELVLWKNPVSDISPLKNLTALTELYMDNTSVSDISVLKHLTNLKVINLTNTSVSNISALDDLTSLSTLYIGGTSVSDISALDDSTNLINLDLSDTSISDISALDDLTKLSTFYLENTSISDISALDNLTNLRWLILKNNSISNISALEGLTSLTYLHLEGNSISDYDPLRRLITTIKGIEDHPGLNLDINIPPLFTEGTSTTRSVAENTAPGTNIGAPVSATDVEDDPLTYTLGGVDTASFSIISTNGQLQTKAALDFETKPSYSVTVSVSDDNGGSDSIAVTIKVTNVNDAPVFSEAPHATRTVAENTPAGTNIGAAISATDPDTGDILTYTLSGIDAAAFDIVSTSGQLQTKAALDSEAQPVYFVTVSVSDGNGGSDSITVTIDVKNLQGLLLYGRTHQVQNAIVTAVPGVNNADDVTAAHLAAITRLNLNTKGMTSLKAGDFDGLTALAYLNLSQNTLRSLPSGIFEELTALKTLYLRNNSLESLPSGIFDELTILTTLHLDGNALSDISELEDVTSLRSLFLSGNPISDYGPLRRLKTAVEEAGFAIDIDVNLNNNPPEFTEGHNTTRTIGENAASGTNIGRPVTATDIDTGDTLTYSLSGTDASSFSIVNTSGQLRTRAALDYETKTSYAVTVTVWDDNGGTDTIGVTIEVTDENEAPSFTEGTSTTRSIAENTAAGINIGTAVAATDPDTSDTLTYTLGGTDAEAFSIASTSGQLQTKAALNFETKTFYSVTVSVSDGNGGSDSIDVRIDITDVNEIIDPPLSERTRQVREAIVAAVPGVNNANDVTPEQLAAITELNLSFKHITSLKSGDFNGLTALTVLYLGLNAFSDISALAGLTALTELNLGRNSISDISSLKDLTALTKLSLYSNSISDISMLAGLTKLTYLDLGFNSISNISALAGLTKLTFLDLGFNSISDISALEDLTKLTFLYLLSENPISDYGPLRRLKAAIENAGNSIDIDIDMTNNPPVFTDGDSTTRSVAENTAPGRNIGAAVSATDADNHSLTYSLGGTDADAFDIVSTSGQLQTKAALDYETKTSYTVTVTVYDGNSGGDRITVTIDVTDDVNEDVEDENLRAAPSVDTSPIIPDRTALLTNFPNPFNPETWIPYQLAKPAAVTLTIYDIRGVVVRELKLGHQPAGVYHSRSRAIYWNGSNAFGEKVATGVYFYTLKAGEFTATRKLLIRK